LAGVTKRTFDVRGRTVLVTGAARGIGAEVARRLHGRGANVALVGLEPEELEARAAELGDRAAWFEADVRDLAALEAAAEATVERFGSIDVVVANAGVAPNGSVRSIDPEVFDRTIEVNLLGVFRTVRATLSHVTRAKGYVLVISSASALVHTPLMAAYTASKAGVEAFADALRAEIAHTGTRVGVAYFSFIDTDMVRKSFARPAAAKAQRDLPALFGRPAPLSEAVEAIERGIERRSRHIWAPRSVGPVLWLRSLVQPLSELAVRKGDFVETLRLAEQEHSELTTALPER
jgi:NAD(P)-dependent dehydrogenase (short-subunit alcohol dehydrogenase family)